MNTVDRMFNRATEAYLEYRRRLDEVSKHTAEAMMRAALVMMTNHEYNHAYITADEYEQRLVFIMSANLKALRNEMLS